MQTPCTHNQTEMIARRDGVEYVRCTACGLIFEAEDLEPVPSRMDGENEENEDESL